MREEIAAVRIQTAFRAIRMRVQYQRTQDATRKLQAIVRGARLRKRLQETRETEDNMNAAATLIQSKWRGKAAREEFKAVKAKARETGALLEAKSALEQKLDSERARTAMEQRARQDDLVKFECMENELRARVAQLEDELAAVKIRAAEDTEAQLIELKNAKDEMATMAAETVQLREWKSSREDQFAELNAKLESIQAHSLQSPLKTTPSKRETNASVSTNVLEDLNVRISEKVELNSKLRKK